MYNMIVSNVLTINKNITKDNNKNEFGESWIFTYDYATKKGIITGSDVNWEEYRVIDGRAAGLLLSDDELKWLRGSWDKAMENSANGQRTQKIH